jgi:hypothetical protein
MAGPVLMRTDLNIVRPHMLDADATPSKILMADLQGDRSYILVFAATDGLSYEIYLPGAGWPGEFAGYMTPSIRNQMTGKVAELLWNEAEEIGVQLHRLLHNGSIAKGGLARAKECVEALIGGRRYGG